MPWTGPLVDDDLEGQSRRVGVREADEGEVELACREAGHEPVRGVLGQGDLDAGVVPVEVGQPAGEVDRPADGNGGADRDMAAQQAGQLIDGAPGPRDRLQRGPGECG
jgi:hypothetical protein